MPRLRALAGAFDRASPFVCCALVTALLGCVSLGALTRGLGEPMVWLAVFGWIVASRKRIHVRIRFFQDRLPQRGHKATEVAIQSAMTAFGALVAAYSVGLIGKNHDLDATTLPISMAWMYAPMVLGGAVTALQGASEILQALRRPPPPGASDEALVE
jgi:TRAP-type C4-dicarboxylate transport system permease small subunit